MNEINMTPFVDILLVLLVIFMLTAPVMKHAVDVNLPKASSKSNINKPNVLTLTVHQSGQYTLGKTDVVASSLSQELEKIAKLNPQTVLHIHGDKQVQYDYVARAMSTAHSAGITKVGFVMHSGIKQ